MSNEEELLQFEASPLTVTSLQQLLLCITWIWPVMTIAHYNTASAGDIAAAVFWGIVCAFCGVRLHAKKRWPFR